MEEKMFQDFMQIAGTIQNTYIERWKESGRKVIGYSGAYFPEEIVHAAGMLPYRLRGVGTTKTTIGDAYFGPVICSFPKCLLQLAGEGKYGFLDGAVITYECDHIRRLYDTWRVADRDHPSIVPPFFYYYGLLHKDTEYGLDWAVEETRKFIARLEEHFGVEVHEADLAGSVKLYNRYRGLLKSLDQLRLGDETKLTGTETLAAFVASTAMPKEDFNRLLDQLLDELAGRGHLEMSGPRLMLVGSVNDDVEFVRLIEDSGAIVVTDSLCFGSRCYEDLVEESGDPLRSILKRYYSHVSCPRIYGNYTERYGFIRDKIAAAGVHGVILQNIRFCDMHGADNGLLERDLEAEGIPVLKIEREYGPLTETGRIKMRVDAFIERIGHKDRTGR